MFSQSVAVLSNPTTHTVEGEGQRGTLRQATLYVGIAAIIAALLNFPLGLGGAIGGFLNVMVSFFAFTGLVYAMGQADGGRANFGDVAYRFSLFIAPISLIFPLVGFIVLYPTLGLADKLIPILAVVAALVLALQSYFAYMASQKPDMKLISSQNALVALFGAVLATWFAQMVITTLAAGWTLVVAPY
jgi:hypothetical protein